MTALKLVLEICVVFGFLWLKSVSCQMTDAVCESSACEECLVSDADCVWSQKKRHCMTSCDGFPDVDCYFPRMFGSSNTDREEICLVAEELHDDNNICFRQKDRTNCLRDTGCVWLGSVVEDGENEFFCVLHLESTNMTQQELDNSFYFEQQVLSSANKAWGQAAMVALASFLTVALIEIRSQ
ncbi:expressed unknown protein [Seminavis robusta]|uniref:Uncharacterized protein n=1 Tax=Seminavis robusta TaxID=568900 RepID=A0A9N8DWQ0_9STRA|nr:expressed unknown protein [Seminavis robusta]|eukprot:Sro434_g142020.1 n/a (183) ;mRNA; r:22234-22782